MQGLNLFDESSPELVWTTVFGETTVQDFILSSLETGREWQSLLVQVASRFAEMNDLDSEKEIWVYEVLERHLVQVVMQGQPTRS